MKMQILFDVSDDVGTSMGRRVSAGLPLRLNFLRTTLQVTDKDKSGMIDKKEFRTIVQKVICQLLDK